MKKVEIDAFDNYDALVQDNHEKNFPKLKKN